MAGAAHRHCVGRLVDHVHGGCRVHHWSRGCRSVLGRRRSGSIGPGTPAGAGAAFAARRQALAGRQPQPRASLSRGVFSAQCVQLRRAVSLGAASGCCWRGCAAGGAIAVLAAQHRFFRYQDGCHSRARALQGHCGLSNAADRNGCGRGSHGRAVGRPSCCCRAP